MSLPGLEDAALPLAELEIVAVDGPAVDLDAALVDHPAPVARRVAELFGEERGQVDPSFRHIHLGHIGGRLVLPHDPREVLLPTPRAVVPVPARNDPAGELELPLHRVVGVLAAVDDELPPLR